MAEKQEKKLKSEPIITLVFLGYFVFLGIGAFSFPNAAMYFPMGIAAAGTLACLALLWPHRYFFKTTDRYRQPDAAEAAGHSILPTVIAISGVLGYLLGVLVLGYIIATSLMGLVACFFLRKNSKALSVAAFTATLVLFIWVVFHVLLKVDLPRAIWW